MASTGNLKEELGKVERELQGLLSAQERGQKVLQKYKKLNNQAQRDFAKNFNKKMEDGAKQIKELEKKRQGLLEEIGKTKEQHQKKKE